MKAWFAKETSFHKYIVNLINYKVSGCCFYINQTTARSETSFHSIIMNSIKGKVSIRFKFKRYRV